MGGQCRSASKAAATLKRSQQLQSPGRSSAALSEAAGKISDPGVLAAFEGAFESAAVAVGGIEPSAATPLQDRLANKLQLDGPLVSFYSLVWKLL